MRGGSGVGKSHLISAIFQTLRRWYARKPSHNVHARNEVLLTAPIGKAIFNITGLTLRSAFALPVERMNSFTNLSNDLATSIRSTM